MNLLEPLLAATATLAAVLAWWFRSLLTAEHARHARELAEQRAQRDAELREQAARTSALFDRMIEGIIVVAANGRIRLANRAAGELFGFAQPPADRTIMEATRQHEIAALVTRLENEPEVLNHEIRLEGVGAVRYFQVNALALRAHDGSRDGAILVFHDLTRIRQLESVRQEFVANVSHELRTPLSLIKSAAETLLDGGKSDPVITTRFLTIIDRHASRLTFLIDDLLLLARLDSGRIELERGLVALHGVVQEVLNDATLSAHTRGAVLTNNVPSGLEAHADPHRLRQVLSNLIDNAIKYGKPQGAVIVNARAVGGGFVEMSVRDDGPGIPAEAKKRIFERFYRVDKARSREQGGTGLGLAIVKNVVEAHGGEVRVESAPGQGAEFFFTLPAATSG